MFNDDRSSVPRTRRSPKAEEVRSFVSRRRSVDHEDDPEILFPSVGLRDQLLSLSRYARRMQTRFSFPSLSLSLSLSLSRRHRRGSTTTMLSLALFPCRVIAENVREPLKRTVD